MTGVSIAALRGAEILLVLRGKEPYKGFWSLPGGSQEFGETMQEAARRELLEETCLVAETLELVDIVEPMARGIDGRVERHFVLAVFVCRDFRGEACAGDDAAAVEWRAIAELAEDGMTPGTAALVRRLAGTGGLLASL